VYASGATTYVDPVSAQVSKSDSYKKCSIVCLFFCWQEVQEKTCGRIVLDMEIFALLLAKTLHKTL
jgi:hypothetical protein